MQSRADAVEVLLQLWKPLCPHFLAGGAAVDLGVAEARYGRRARQMETFVRPLWGIVALEAGGDRFADWDIFRRGLLAGTGPGSVGFWGEPVDFDQRFVEMASLAYTLAFLPTERLHAWSDAERAQIARYLEAINRHTFVQNNWIYFRVLVNAALLRTGLGGSAAQIEHDFQRLEAMYLADGWYGDGVGGPCDHYGAFAFHFYGLVYTRMRPDDEERCRKLRDRTREFLGHYERWFGAGGEALPFGRSLQYRFATGAIFAAAAWAGVDYPLARLKARWASNLRFWLAQPCFSETGLLPLGYRYANSTIVESYGSTGGPYWACKALVALAMPADHPFWTVEEEPLAPVRTPTVQVVPQKIFGPDDGPDVWAISNASCPSWDPRHGPSKYAKFAYASRSGFGVPLAGRNDPLGNLDSMLLVSSDGRNWQGRERVLEGRVEDGALYSRWDAGSGVVIQTWLLVAPVGHVRVHRIETPCPLQLREGGFPLAAPEPDEVVARTTDDGALVLALDEVWSALHDLQGGRRAESQRDEPGTNISHPLTMTPFLRHVILPGVHTVAACFATGGGGFERVEAEFGRVRVLTVEPASVQLVLGDTVRRCAFRSQST